MLSNESGTRRLLPSRRQCVGAAISGREDANRVRTGVLLIEPDKVARIEIDHNTSRSRSSLMACVESVPPRRCLRLARNARVN